MTNKDCLTNIVVELHKELEIGETSGMIADFDRKKHLQQLHAKYLKK